MTFLINLLKIAKILNDKLEPIDEKQWSPSVYFLNVGPSLWTNTLSKNLFFHGI